MVSCVCEVTRKHYKICNEDSEVNWTTNNVRIASSHKIRLGLVSGPFRRMLCVIFWNTVHTFKKNVKRKNKHGRMRLQIYCLLFKEASSISGSKILYQDISTTFLDLFVFKGLTSRCTAARNIAPKAM
jgi:hypothetical protein